jgi:hypothetical protein
VDSGTTLVYITTAAYNSYLSATGGKLDNTTGLVQIPDAKVADLKSRFFNIAGLSTACSRVYEAQKSDPSAIFALRNLSN